MGRIQSSVGLVTGIPITDTVEQLLAFSARPRDLLVSRNEKLQAERVAVSELTALVIGVQFAIDNLGSSSIFDEREVSSSDESLISTTATGTPAPGVYEFTPVRQVQNHQLISDRFAKADEPIGAGEFSIRFGGLVDKGLRLDDLNGGDGVEHGRIRITDRSGASAQIDLRFAETVDDVITAINDNNDVNVSAEVVGDRLQLRDNTGQTSSNLRVQDVGIGTTAADLGLGNVDSSESEILGEDIVSLHENLGLDRLNDGNGVFLREAVPDLEVTFSDGSTPLEIEFLAQIKGQTTASAVTEAANGDDAILNFTSVEIGAEWDGYDVIFENDDEITSGEETVAIDTVAKEIRFKIDSGSTRAVHIARALNEDVEASKFFTASVSPDGDGTGVIDVADTGTSTGGAIEHASEETIGDLLTTINAADPNRLRAQISADGDRIELIDLTADPNAPPVSGGPNLWNLGDPVAQIFSVRSSPGGTAAEDLGIAAATANGRIDGERRISGLKTVLLDSLGGGQGLGDLGTLRITDRSGNNAYLDFSSAETLEDVVNLVNGFPEAADFGVTASINSARNGIQLVDTSGGTGNLVVSNADATNTADALGIAIDADVARVNSGSLNLQTFHTALTLDSLNNGRGIGRGSFVITDSAGGVGAINPTVSRINTVGELIDRINSINGLNVDARVNDTGDGIVLVDRADGDRKLSVRDVGTGSAAADLKIAGTSVARNIGGVPSQVIDGASTLQISLDDDDTLNDLVEKINEAGGDVSATLFNSGSGARPFRLSISSELSGSAGEIVVDGSQFNFSFQELVAAKDALLLLGPSDAPIAAALATSSTNEFASVVDGITINIEDTSLDSVTVQVDSTVEPVVSQLNLFVEQYNGLRDRLDELTFFDENENTVGVLFGRSEALRVEFDLANLISGRFFGAGPIQSLGEVGLRLNANGRLAFDEERFRSEYEENSNAVEEFFSNEDFGVASKMVAVAEQLAGVDNSVLLNRTQTLQRTMESNDERIISLNLALEQERESLLEEFFRLETIVGQLQNNLSTVSQIQGIPPLSINLGR